MWGECGAMATALSWLNNILVFIHTSACAHTIGHKKLTHIVAHRRLRREGSSLDTSENQVELTARV